MHSVQVHGEAPGRGIEDGLVGHEQVERRPPNCLVGWSDVAVTGRETVQLDPWAAGLDAASTARIAVMARERALWIQFHACFGLALAGDWDVQETLARGLAARPHGTLLEVIAAAYPDRLGHGFEVEEYFRRHSLDREYKRFDWESDEAYRVLEDHLRGLNFLDLSDPDMAFAATFAALDGLCRWRFGKLPSAQPDLAIAHAHEVLELIREADLDLSAADDDPVNLE